MANFQHLLPQTSSTAPAKMARFRVHNRRGKNGKVWTSYWYDMRGRGHSDVPLGTNLERAIKLWERLANGEAANGIRPAWCPARIGARKAGRRRKFTRGVWAGFPRWAKSMYLNAERRSCETGRHFTLTVAEFWTVLERANGACELTGIPLDEESIRGPFSPSIDRVDSAKGYFVGNVRLVCLIANCAMNTWGDEPLRVLARYLVESDRIK